MRLNYLANIRIPTEKAHGIQIVKMCEAFGDNGVELNLIVPSSNKSPNDAYEYYGVRSNFRISTVKSPRIVNLGPVGFVLGTVVFFFSYFFSQRFFSKTLVFVRDVHLAFLLAIFGIPFVLEIHQDFYNFFSKYTIKKARLVIFITEGVKNKFLSYGLKNEDKIVVLPDAVGDERFNLSRDKNLHRDKVGLPKDKPIVFYSGHLYEWKGVDTLAESIDYIEHDVRVVFVGGTVDDVANFRAKYEGNPRIEILGHKSYSEMPSYKQSADVLVIPNSGKYDISKSYTSPLKLFSAMASGIPIVISDLPSMREIVDESMVVFFKPDDPQDLADKVNFIFNNPEEGNRIAENAVLEAKKHTWRARAEKIISHF